MPRALRGDRFWSAHKDVATMMIYTHVLNRGAHEVRSALDGCTSGPMRRGVTPDFDGQPGQHNKGRPTPPDPE